MIRDSLIVYHTHNCHSLEHTTRSFPSRNIAFGSCICFEEQSLSCDSLRPIRTNWNLNQVINPSNRYVHNYNYQLRALACSLAYSLACLLACLLAYSLARTHEAFLIVYTIHRLNYSETVSTSCVELLALMNC